MALLELLKEAAGTNDRNFAESLPLLVQISKLFSAEHGWQMLSTAPPFGSNSIGARLELCECPCVLVWEAQGGLRDVLVTGEQFFSRLLLLQKALHMQHAELSLQALFYRSMPSIQSAAWTWLQSDCRTLRVAFPRAREVGVAQCVRRLFPASTENEQRLQLRLRTLRFDCALVVSAFSALKSRELHLELKQEARLRGRRQAFSCTVSNEGIETGSLNLVLSGETREGGTTGMELALYLRLGELRISIAELLELQKGALLSVDWDPDKPVTLMFDDEELAYGRLCRRGTELLFMTEAPARVDAPAFEEGSDE